MWTKPRKEDGFNVHSFRSRAAGDPKNTWTRQATGLRKASSGRNLDLNATPTELRELRSIFEECKEATNGEVHERLEEALGHLTRDEYSFKVACSQYKNVLHNHEDYEINNVDTEINSYETKMKQLCDASRPGSNTPSSRRRLDGRATIRDVDSVYQHGQMIIAKLVLVLQQRIKELQDQKPRS